FSEIAKELEWFKTWDKVLNDSNPDFQELNAVVVTQPARGTVTLMPDGGFTYTHTAEGAADDSFIYQVRDVFGVVTIATVRIEILPPPNRAPSLVADTVILSEDGAASFNPLDNDADPDGDPLTLVSAGPPDRGSLVVSNDSTLVFTPPVDFSGLVTATYTVADGRGGQATGRISFVVTPVNDPPRGGADRVVLTSYQALSLDLLSNDTDADDDPLTILSVNQPDVGAVEVLGTEIVYTAPIGWIGTTTFTYVVVDPSGARDVVKVTVVVPEAAQVAARSLSEEVGAPTLAAEFAEPRFVIEEAVVTVLQGVRLFTKAIFQTLRAVELPAAFLGLAFLVFLGLGGLDRLPILASGRTRRYLSVVLLDRESQLPVHDSPDPDATPIYNFSPNTTGIIGVGRGRRSGNSRWIPVETPRAEGWIEAKYVTEQVDIKAFMEDPRPAKLVDEFAKRLRRQRDISPLIAERGQVVAISGRPNLIPRRAIHELMRRANSSIGVLRPDGFEVAVVARFLGAYDATPEINPEIPHAASSLIPAELRNFRYLVVGGVDTESWLVFFEYRGGRPRIVGLSLDR
ncbi:MAG TPA: tandem-95 repeat protein, partial [Acidimicrobiia bacterium]|nr:tandem-95 repeat protein [Acidimicrobiia bacterium]